jgi:hypothetical protein
MSLTLVKFNKKLTVNKTRLKQVNHLIKKIGGMENHA